jgi:hypothetical protein
MLNELWKNWTLKNTSSHRNTERRSAALAK